MQPSVSRPIAFVFERRARPSSAERVSAMLSGIALIKVIAAGLFTATPAGPGARVPIEVLRTRRYRWESHLPLSLHPSASSAIAELKMKSPTPQ
jgi:hypothetical protein